MANTVRVGAMWVNEDKGTKNGNIDRKVIEELLDKYAGNIRFSMFENERKRESRHPDYYLVFFYPDDEGGSEPKKSGSKGFGGGKKKTTKKGGAPKGHRKSMF